jgi:hypothetical protein
VGKREQEKKRQKNCRGYSHPIISSHSTYIAWY